MGCPPPPYIKEWRRGRAGPLLLRALVSCAHQVAIGEHSISKKKSYDHARSIVVMHSNERGECCPRTLVDCKRKRYDNAVDVVVRLHDRPILVPKVRHLRDLHTFGSVTSHELTIQQCRGRASSARRRDDGDDEATGAGLRLSTATI